MSDDLVMASLMTVAETAGDITPAVYEAYFASCPGSAELMTHIDDTVRGRMLEEVMRLVMLADYAAEQKYLDFEMKNHRLAYSVESPMYANLLGAVVSVVRDAMGDTWRPEHEGAWAARLALLQHEIDQRV